MKILITYASAGAGHRVAAEALYKGLKEIPTHDVTLLDALDKTSTFYKSSYSSVYTFLISKVPFIWAFIFHLINIRPLLPLVRLMRRVHNTINAGGFAKYLGEENFDCVYSTHFFPTEIAAYLRRTQQIKSRVVTIVTDYDVHTIWLAKGVDCYCVASDWTKDRILKLGVADQRCVVTGIPTHERFTIQHDKFRLKDKLGLEDDIFTVLIATGSFGIGPIEEIVKKVDGIQVVVICGHNKDLYKRLTALKRELVKVNGLVDNMDEWMCVADCMVTKPGGLSVSEALVSELPLIFFSAIPGQEEGNIRALAEYGIGKSDLTIEEIGAELEHLSSSEDYLMSQIEKTKALARPRAVDDIISIIP